MYELSVTLHFDAAHALRGYQGKCENIHGHRFEVAANLRANGTNDIGITYDFVELRALLNKVLGDFDHTCLNDHPPFDKINPSSENIASVVYGRLSELLNNSAVHLHSVQVWESPGSKVTYFPD